MVGNWYTYQERPQGWAKGAIALPPPGLYNRVGLYPVGALDQSINHKYVLNTEQIYSYFKSKANQ